MGIGLADDLRAIRTALIKAHFAGDFEAAFDLVVFQMVRAVFARGYTASWHALDIKFNETADRPTTRTNDDDFASWSPGEAMLADWSHLPFEWMEGDDDAACFAALRALPRADKEKLFAAAVARTVKGQLAFEHDARPELEATVARLDIDFAKHVRPCDAATVSRGDPIMATLPGSMPASERSCRRAISARRKARPSPRGALPSPPQWWPPACSGSGRTATSANPPGHGNPLPPGEVLPRALRRHPPAPAPARTEIASHETAVPL